MKFWAMTLMMAFCVSASAQTHSDVTSVQQQNMLAKASELFSKGKYETTAEELDRVEASVSNEKNPDKKLLGLIAYWKGIVYSRLIEYPLAIKNFQKSLDLEYAPTDIHYEYGQALYASEKLQESRIHFRESLRSKFKSAVSLYYIAFITKQLGEREKALAFFKSVDKLEKSETQDIRQAVEFQIGDIYLEQMENHKDAFRAVEKFVVPQYEKAFKVDRDSALAPQIKEKIVALQRKYDLVLFNLRNGRPTQIPPYFLRIAQEFGYDTNVTFSPNETTISKAKQGSEYSKTDVLGKYTFYLSNIMSIAPEIRFTNSYYFNRVPEIYRNDNRLMAPALRTAYEHTMFKKPAATLLDYDFNYSERDVNAKEQLDFSSRAHVFMLGERFNFFDSGETTLRVRHRTFNSYIDSQNASAWSFVAEQIKPVGKNTLLFYFSADRTRVSNEIFDTNAMTLRTDFIMSSFRDWFSSSVGMGVTRNDPINNRSARGIETMLNPNARLYRKIFRNFKVALKYDYMKNNSRDEASFAYKKQTYAFELEYLF